MAEVREGGIILSGPGIVDNDCYRRFAKAIGLWLDTSTRTQTAIQMGVDEMMGAYLTFGIKPEVEDVVRRVNAKLDLMGIEK